MNILEGIALAIPVLKLSGKMRSHQKRRAFDAIPPPIPEPHPLDTSYKAALFRAQKIAKSTWLPAYIVQHKKSGNYYADYSMSGKFKPKAGEVIVKMVTKDDLRLHGFESLGKVRTWSKPASVGKRLHKYVDPCMKRYNNPAYCWRVAWSIYCSNVNPKYPGCTKYGKKWGKPYSGKMSKR